MPLHMPVGKRKAARFIMVAGRIIRQPVAIARPGSVHGMIFKAPLIRVNVELPAAAPLTSAAVVIVITIADGTAWAELVVIAPTMMEPVELAPRLRKKRRSFSEMRPIPQFRPELPRNRNAGLIRCCCNANRKSHLTILR